VQLTIFFDRSCWVCRKLSNALIRHDKKSVIKWVDISSEKFRPEFLGKKIDDMTLTLHVFKGEWFTGHEAVRKVFEELGFSRLVWISRLFIINWLFSKCYDLFERIRPLTTLRLCKGCGRKN